LEAQLYKIIQNDIKRKILNNELKPGQKLPSESELIKAYSASKMTVRNALFDLEQAGLVYSIQRVGNFVATLEIDKYILLFDEVSKIKGISRTEIQRSYFLKQDDLREAGNSFEEDVKIFVIERILYSDNIIAAFDKKIIRYEKNLNITIDEFANENFANYISKCFDTYTIKQMLYIEAVRAGREISAILNINETDAIAKITQNYYNEKDKLIAISEINVKPDYIEFHAKSL
jgi:DNA-binding GntR family transcriptional regulator